MSALGQKRTFAVQNGMSALPPKADIKTWPSYVWRRQLRQLRDVERDAPCIILVEQLG